MAAPRVALNHVILYVRRVGPSLRFYRDLLGFRVIEEMDGYARLRSAGTGATIALHVSPAPRAPRRSRQVTLYFETHALAAVCRSLARRGVRFDQPPKRMPWGWDHAYLRDPDGYRISLYWAGPKRFRPTPR